MDIDVGLNLKGNADIFKGEIRSCTKECRWQWTSNYNNKYYILFPLYEAKFSRALMKSEDGILMNGI